MGNNWDKRRENLRIHRDWDIRNFRRKDMAFKLSQRSLDRLDGVHPDLVKVVKKAIEYTDVDFGVIYGVRDLETQKKIKDIGLRSIIVWECELKNKIELEKKLFDIRK